MNTFMQENIFKNADFFFMVFQSGKPVGIAGNVKRFIKKSDTLKSTAADA